MYSDSTKDYRYYRCSSRKLEGTACGSDLVAADEVEAAVWKKVSTVLGEPEIIADEIKRQQKSGADSQLSEDRAAAQRRLAKIEREQQRLIRRLRDTEDDGLAELYELEIIQGQNQKRQLEKAIAEIDARLAAEQRAIQNLQSLTAYCTQVASKLSAFSFEEKRLTLEAVGAKVQLNGKKWILQTRIPYQTVGDMFNLSTRRGRRIYWL
jgi:Recombinase zinc beta ribbon domain